jgi:hypothetical protein
MTDLHPIRILGLIFFQCILIFLKALVMPSPVITSVYIAVAVIGFVSGILAYLRKSHFLRLLCMWSALAAMTFFASLSAWMILFDNSLLVAFLLVVVLILVGAMPYINEEWSKFIYWELLSPRTKAGKLFNRFILVVIVIWTFIARRGVIYHRPGDMEYLPSFLWYFAILIYFTSVAFTFYHVYQTMFFEPTLPTPIWKKWKWKWKRKSRKKTKNESSELP